jgi:2-polyprenyl-3-methyl-5-hydroxy-6-metoxy-1,4-benzoquinol methylase
MTDSAALNPELKQKHRKIWASGDYPSMVETFLTPLGPRLVEACAIQAGDRVLDVAAGTGNASIPAAATGAQVTASDLRRGCPLRDGVPDHGRAANRVGEVSTL